MHDFPRAIAHVDGDCFFAAVELLNRPELKGKAVCVCNRTDQRGIVVSATYEARPFGIRAGTPVFQAKKLCPQAIFLPSHFDRYGMTSHKLMQILRTFSPDVETYSIDEAYLDLTGLRLLYRTNYQGIGAKIQTTVTQKLGITVSVGIAPTKLLAKIASDFKKPAGLTIIPLKTTSDFLRTIPIGKIPGVGRNTEALLQKYGLVTAYDLAHFPTMKKILGKRGLELQTELLGTPVYKVATNNALPKSLSHTRTFPDFSSDEKYIFSFSLKLLLDLGMRLREFELVAGEIDFFLLTKNFQSFGQKMKLSPSTNQDHIFIEAFKTIFLSIFRQNTLYRKAGFSFSDLQDTKGGEQHTLFESPENPRKIQENHLYEALDSISRKYGEKGIMRGILLKFPLK
jgi:DNA polymerase-4/DNA polymerase V